jgi:hypothetical protein
MQIKIIKTAADWDSDNVEFLNDEGNKIGVGYKGRKSGRICILRCPKCDMENYMMVAAQGLCAFCGFNPNELPN